MMLQSEVCDVVAQRIEEVVVAIMRSSEKSCGLLHYIAIVLPDLGRGLNRFRAVGCDVEFDGRRLPLIKRNSLEVFASDYGRVDQGVKGDGVETNLVTGVRRNRKGRSEFPSLRYSK